MEEVRRVFVIAMLSVATMVVPVAPAAWAKDSKPKKAPPTGEKSAAPPGEALNACGCYRKDNGACACTDKKGKCECPGECEPVGCDQKREKEMAREMAAEVKRAQDEEKRRRDAEEAREKAAAADAGITTADEAPAPKGKNPQPPQAGHKDGHKDGPKADPR